MIQFIVSVRDRQTDTFSRPMFVAHIGAAIRSFADEINRTEDKNNGLAAHPEDYDLYELGQFDDSTGAFVSQPPRQIAIGKDCVRK